MMINEKSLVESMTKRFNDDQKLVVVDGYTIKLYFTPEQKRCYELSFFDIQSEKRLLWWICHLLEKNWITKDHIRLIISISGVKTYG